MKRLIFCRNKVILEKYSSCGDRLQSQYLYRCKAQKHGLSSLHQRAPNFRFFVSAFSFL